MKRRLLGKSGVSVSEVGVGTWQFGGDWGEVTEEKALETLRASVEAGINFFDTADVYGAGRSESLIGKFLKETRAKVLSPPSSSAFPSRAGLKMFLGTPSGSTPKGPCAVWASNPSILPSSIARLSTFSNAGKFSSGSGL